MSNNTEIKEHESVAKFREYLRISSVQPNVNYEPCVEFLKKEALSLNLPVEVYNVAPGKPVVVITWQGLDKSLSAILLNSHMDVVPVDVELWTHNPFTADKDEDGNIYARGAQDMKCVGIQYIEAIRQLKKDGIQLKRTIHISFVPDEEIGGVEGMKIFVTTPEFNKLNVGFALDEGRARPHDNFNLFYGERSIWSMMVHCPGATGHGSLLLDDTAGEKVRIILDRFMDFRTKERNKLREDHNLTNGDVTTINLTGVQGGKQFNVLPSEIILTFDVRLAVSVEHKKFEQMISKWCEEAGNGVYFESKMEPKVPVTKLDNYNPWWRVFKAECQKMNIQLVTQIFPGATDSRFIRALGIPALGFSPMNRTPFLGHCHDEFLNEKVFLRGIDIYCKLISALGNVGL